MLSLVLGFVLNLLLLSSFAQAEISWAAVTDKETTHAACVDLKPPTEKEMIDFLDSKIVDPDARASALVDSVSFKDEVPEMISWFEGLHKDPIFGNDVAAPELQVQNCDKVLCAMEQLYGKKIALRMLYIFVKTGITTSRFAVHKPDNYQNWKLSEIDDALVALESIPPHLLPVKNRQLLHFLDGYTLSSYGDTGQFVVGNAKIEVFTNWNEQSRPYRIASLIHELGHVFANSNLDQSDQWKAMPRQYISAYAETNDAEDFAESFLAYRIAPKKLKKVSPLRYNYIRDLLFKGLEFNTEKDCEAPFENLTKSVEKIGRDRRENSLWFASNKEKFNKQEQQLEEKAILLDQAWSFCGAIYLNEVNGSSADETHKCLESIYQKNAILRVAGQQEKENISFKNISTKQASEIPVSNKVVNLLRQRLRLKALQEVEKIYSSENFQYASTDQACADHVFVAISLKQEPLLNSSPSAMQSILAKACSQSLHGTILQRWIGPNFSKILP